MSEVDYRTLSLKLTKRTEIFTKPNGTTLWAVDAVDENGHSVPGLRTFAAELPWDRLHEFKLKRYDHPEHGTTWTILDPSGGPSKKGADDGKLADLERRVSALEQRFGVEPEAPVHPAQHRLGDEVRGPDFFNG